jgi:AraC-like DNA-binding protein
MHGVKGFGGMSGSEEATAQTPASDPASGSGDAALAPSIRLVRNSDDVRQARRTVSLGPLGLVEVVAMQGVAGETTPYHETEEPQVGLALASSFSFLSEESETLCDPNQMFVIGKGALTRDRPFNAAPFMFVVVTPSPELCDLITEDDAVRRGKSASVVPASPRAQYLAALLASKAAAHPSQRLLVEESLVALLKEGLTPEKRKGVPRSPSTARLVARVKEVLAASRGCLSLVDIARAAGASPAYLTDAFRRYEGMPIARYQMRLRLARALVLLEGGEELTGVALDLGFSSHSHFTAAFRATFGVPPSVYREQVRS